jgi:hypothetical protein
MKNVMLKATLVLTLIVMSSFTLLGTFKVNKKIIGEWEYSIPQAPYEYQKGVLILSKEGKELKGEMLVGGYATVLEDMINVKSNVKANMDVQGEMVSFDLNFTKKTFEGTVSYSQGSMEITGNKKDK